MACRRLSILAVAALSWSGDGVDGEEVPTARVAGVLIDQRTREPVPDFLVRIEGPPLHEDWSCAEDGFVVRTPPRRAEDVMTGEDGRFTSEGAFEAGTLTFRLIGHRADDPDRGGGLVRSRRALHTVDPSTPPAELPLGVDVGPTHRILAELPAGTSLADFEAAFPTRPLGTSPVERFEATGRGSELIASRLGAPPAPPAPERVARLRAGSTGDPMWVRFPGPLAVRETFAGEEVGHDLHLRSHDGTWSGSARVESIAGIGAEPVSIELQPRGVLEGSVLDASGAPVTEAWLRLTEAGRPDGVVGEIGVDGDGRFAFRWLRAVEHELEVVTHPWCDGSSRTVSIEPGGKASVELRLVPREAPASIRGFLRLPAAGAQPYGVRLRLVQSGDPDVFRVRSVFVPSGDEEHLAPFRFDGLAEGEYRLEPDARGERMSEPHSLVVSAPADGIELFWREDSSTFGLRTRGDDEDGDGG